MSAFITTIIPCFNSARWVGAAIESVLAQTHPTIEVVVVDDGSTDESVSIARGFAGDRVQVISQPPRGASAARNVGLRAARGDYVQYLDADDLLAPNKVAVQLALIERTRARLSSSAWGRFEDSPDHARFIPTTNWRDITGVEFLQLHWEEGGMMQPAAWLAERGLLAEVGPWNETLSLNDDGEYFARVMLRAGRIVYCSEARTYYRVLRGSLSRRRDRRALDSLFQSVDLATGHLLRADSSLRSLAAAAYAWKWTAFELYPGAPDLSANAERKSRELGGSARPMPGGRKFQYASKLLGWRLAKRLTTGNR